MLAISRQTGRKCCADFSCKPGPTTRLPGNCFRAGAHEPAVVVSDSAAGARPAIRPAAYRARRGRGRSVQRRPNPQLRQRRFTSWRRPTGPGRARCRLRTRGARRRARGTGQRPRAAAPAYASAGVIRAGAGPSHHHPIPRLGQVTIGVKARALSRAE